MTKIIVFTPTNRYGGLDVLEASIARQNVRGFTWVIVDELLKERLDVWKKVAKRLDDVEVVLLEPKAEVRNSKRNLVAAYNQAAQYAQDNEFDLFVSLQDYIWAPEDGLERFLFVNENKPDDLITGITHISLDPFSTQIIDPQGLYTIFGEPYFSKPKRIKWKDSRLVDIYVGLRRNAIASVDPKHWEANWAAVPVKFFNKVKWTPIYDLGYAYENMDFSQQCAEQLNADTWMDTGNVAISLPHKKYFDGEEEDLLKYNNRQLYESMWMT